MSTSADTISIRLATPDDGAAVTRLAQLDCTTVPSGPLLLAERDDRLEAALALEDGATFADPFARSEELVMLLRTRAAMLQPRRPLFARARVAITTRRHARAYAA